ncbi:hypothetical protein CRENPOLYSF2_3120003 [Crenothrix polyspora]|uniref:Uncharacterized protein n=1 Tax=Crenothrix polyspora TaxID=360316 RepID=A0A1R4HAH6_9GAMM|nr:hypothetical protein CRENPOLYSF2_3120003 [Crenothrix polyspora]
MIIGSNSREKLSRITLQYFFQIHQIKKLKICLNGVVLEFFGFQETRLKLVVNGLMSLLNPNKP